MPELIYGPRRFWCGFLRDGAAADGLVGRRIGYGGQTRLGTAPRMRVRGAVRRPGDMFRRVRPSRCSREKMSAVSDEASKALLEALGALLRAQRMSAELSLRELSERTNISNAYLSELERGLHEPSLRVLRSITSALGLPLGPTLASAGLLGGGDEGGREASVGGTEAAILRDQALTEPQRIALLSVYRSFMQARRSF